MPEQTLASKISNPVVIKLKVLAAVRYVKYPVLTFYSLSEAFLFFLPKIFLKDLFM